MEKISRRQLQSHPVLDIIWRVLIVLIGDALGAVSVNNFLVPAHILSGGITGLAQVVNHYLPIIGIGTLYFIFNIPLFILGYKYLGKKFVGLTGIAIIGFSLFTDLLHLHFSTPEDPLLLGLYGGVLAGLASGLVIRIGGSMGGTDILSMVMFRLTGKSVGGTGFFMNVIVVLLSMFVFGIPAGMYTLVSMFAASRVVNTLMNYQQRKTALIVTARASEISEAIGERLGRGSTLMQAYGTYSHRDLGVLMCAMTSLEIGELKTITTELDPNSFISILDTTSVIGRFKQIFP
jgi:uncharacterized membrane-anchored protein YitT (DUF2179 family)